MKPVSVPSPSRVLNSLLKKARRHNVILESADGERFVLASLSDWQGIDVGDSDDFAVEVSRTARNKELVKMMAKRRARDKPTVSAEEARRRLGLK